MFLEILKKLREKKIVEIKCYELLDKLKLTYYDNEDQMKKILDKQKLQDTVNSNEELNKLYHKLNNLIPEIKNYTENLFILDPNFLMLMVIVNWMTE